MNDKVTKKVVSHTYINKRLFVRYNDGSYEFLNIEKDKKFKYDLSFKVRLKFGKNKNTQSVIKKVGPTKITFVNKILNFLRLK